MSGTRKLGRLDASLLARHYRRPDRRDEWIGAQIRKARRLAGITQQDLAALIGVSRNQVKQYEHGRSKLSVTRLHDIAVATARPMTFFLSWIDAPLVQGEAANQAQVSLALTTGAFTTGAFTAGDDAGEAVKGTAAGPGGHNHAHA